MITHEIGDFPIGQNELDTPGKDSMGVSLDRGRKGRGREGLVICFGRSRFGGVSCFLVGERDLEIIRLIGGIVKSGAGFAGSAIGFKIVKPVRFPNELIVITTTRIPESVGGLKGAAVIAFGEAIVELLSAVAARTPIETIVGFVRAHVTPAQVVFASGNGDPGWNGVLGKAVGVDVSTMTIGTVEETLSAKFAGRVLRLTFLVVGERRLYDESFFANVAGEDADGFAGVKVEKVGEEHVVAEEAGVILWSVSFTAAQESADILNPVIVIGGRVFVFV